MKASPKFFQNNEYGGIFSGFYGIIIAILRQAIFEDLI